MQAVIINQICKTIENNAFNKSANNKQIACEKKKLKTTSF